MKIALSIPAVNPSEAPIKIEAPAGIPTGGLFDTGQNAIQLLFSLLIIAAIIFAIGFLILAGVRMIVYGEKKEEIAKVKTSLSFVIVGLILVFLAFLIIRMIGYFFGVSLLP